MPREILSDQGSDLPKGIRQFCQAHPETCCVYDLKPKVAPGLKRELGAEPAWQEVSTQATQTIARVQPTALAALAPPRQRRKARYRNVGELVAWGGGILQYLATNGSQQPEWDRQRVEQAVGWVGQYRQELEHWHQWIEGGTLTEHFVKTHGGSAEGAPQFHHRLAEAGTLPRTQQRCTELIQFGTDEGAKAKAGERLGAVVKSAKPSLGNGSAWKANIPGAA